MLCSVSGDLSREIRAVAEKVAEIQAAMGSSSAAGAVQADQLSDALHAPVERAIMTALQARWVGVKGDSMAGQASASPYTCHDCMP